ncbi:ABC transporter ATP-binding protein [Candidatus Saccharibacteria bacterium]|nr:ABC transporter ATP-binding protein [Candidatus Saccharibacteria bacterium]
MFREQGKFIRDYLKVAELNPWYFGLTIITAVLYKTAAIIRPFVAALIIKALTEQNAHDTYLYIGIFAAIYIFYRAMLFLNWRVYSWNMIYSCQNIRNRIFKKLVSADQNFSKKIGRGKLLNIVNVDVFEIGDMNDDIVEYFTTGIQIIAVAAISFRYNIIISILMAASVIFYAVYATKKDREFNFFWWRTQAENDHYSNFLDQILTGLQEVKVFGMLPQLHRHLDRIQERYDRNYVKQRRAVTKRDGDIDIPIYLLRAAAIAVGLVSMANGHMGIDILILLISYHEQIISYTKGFIGASVEIRLVNAAVRRVNSILNYRGENQTVFGDLELDHISGALQFKNVSLRLNHRQILKDVSFRIRPHEFVAIVGYPGSGKTKLFDLILRLNRPTHGKITLDKININEFSRDIYTSNVAVANQTPFIFNTSIRNNLSFVDPDIKHQIEACKTAGIHNFIETLPLGYNTILRENASNISGGQRQMISIARTILTNAEILLLDDVTTSLDPDTAKLVPRLINRLKKKHTVILITKKPELMKGADRIIVLDRGKIVDSGTHEKLMERCSIYRSLQTLRSADIGGIV